MTQDDWCKRQLEMKPNILYAVQWEGTEMTKHMEAGQKVHRILWEADGGEWLTRAQLARITGYKKTPSFIALLEEMTADGLLEREQEPIYHPALKPAYLYRTNPKQGYREMYYAYYGGAHEYKFWTVSRDFVDSRISG